jgi:hypothetical protein
VTSEPVARIEDCRSQGWCCKGVRTYLARRGVPMEQFLRDGLTLAWLRAQGDAYAVALANAVEDRHGRR